MTFNNIRSIHDFVCDSNVNVQISFFGTAFLCKKERVPITFFRITIVHLNKTIVSISIENLAKRVNELAIALKDNLDSTVEEKKQCNTSADKLFNFACQSLEEKQKLNVITVMFICIRNFFKFGGDDDLDFARDIHEFKHLH